MHHVLVFRGFYASMMLVVFLVTFVPQSSYARDTLTERKIKAFYKESSEVQMMGADVVEAFMEEHIHEKSETTVHSITNMPGLPPQKQTMVYDKDSLVRDSRQAFEVGEVELVENKVLSIEISSDGRSAKVKDSTYSVFNLTIPTPQGMMQMMSEQSMLCDDNLVIGRDGVIQSKGAVCSAEINVRPN